MEMKLDSDHEVIVDISGADCKNSISGDHPNTEDVDLHHEPADSGLRSRKKVAAIPSNISQTDNIDEVSVAASASEILETTEAASPPVKPALMESPSQANDGHPPTRKRLIKVIEFILFVCFTLLLIISAAMNKLKDIEIESLGLWKWCVLGWPIFCGRLFSEWLINIIVFLIENDHLGGKKHAYVYTSRKTNGCLKITWLFLVCETWLIFIALGVSISSDIGTGLYDICKCFCFAFVFVCSSRLRCIATNDLCDSFKDKKISKSRILENHFHQYILQTLSGTPLRELSEIHSSSLVSCSGSNVIDVQKPQRIKSRMIETASQTGFYTLPKAFGECKDLMNPDEHNNRNITTEREAKAAGHLIFRNVAKPGYNYIEEEDLLRFLIKEEVDMVLPSIGGEEKSGRINEKSFLNSVVSMYMKSKFLEHSLNDIKEAILESLKLVNVLMLLVLIILLVISTRIVTTEVSLFISSQFLLVVLTFGNSAKSTFEAMIFVFIKHPFDVGDRCVIDGVQVVVEEVSILTTVFLRYDNEKIYYPNSILATKSISNYNRSPEMGDTVEFDLDISTSVESISALKAKIKTYIDSKPHLWRPKHSIRVREIEDANKMNMRLYVTHTINFQDYEEKCDRRSNLVLELMNIFQQLGIKYHILPPTYSD